MHILYFYYISLLFYFFSGLQAQQGGVFSLINPYLLLAFIIWLGIVTIILIVLIIMVARRRSQNNHYYDNTKRNHYPSMVYGSRSKKDMEERKSEIYDEPGYINEGLTAF